MNSNYRRAIFGTLVGLTVISFIAIMYFLLSAEGLSLAESIFLACFTITLPWTAIGFWNAVIGFGLMRFSKDPALHVFPEMGDIKGDEKITKSTALAMCIRNEDVAQVKRNVAAMMARLTASGYAKNFHFYILSDSSFEDIIMQERKIFAELEREWAGKLNVTYRLRDDNAGFKAGNIRDFCERWGHNHEFMITLDADSVMSASTILRMVRAMEKNEKLGILQSLVVGLPSDSAFSRVFQFGMRLGMRSFTLGSAWWQSDCGPYWGHNAIIRMKPFIEHCHLPILEGNGPLSGWILSHDQVEAVYMRRAGYECRVLAEETDSFEENPPHILEFIRRDLRWCHGNMQYFHLLREPGLYLTSRIQLMLAILMFIGSPAWMLLVVVGTASLVFPDTFVFTMQTGSLGYIMFGMIMTMVFAPKIVSFFDVLMRSRARTNYGGGAAIITGTFFEIIFSMMLAPIVAVANTIFLFNLLVRKKAKGWAQQSRHAQSLPLGTTVKHLWPQTIFGALGLMAVMSYDNLSAAMLAIVCPVFIGPLLSIPFAMFTSYTPLGWLTARIGFWQIPEEQTPPVIVRALNLPALAARAEADMDTEVYSPLSIEQLIDIDVEMENARRA